MKLFFTKHPSDSLADIMRPFHETRDRLKQFIKDRAYHINVKTEEIHKVQEQAKFEVMGLNTERDQHIHAQNEAIGHLTSIERMLGSAPEQKKVA